MAEIAPPEGPRAPFSCQVPPWLAPDHNRCRGASLIGAASITALFFGQRVAKDYPGAAVLVPYFILMLVLMYLSNPFARP